MLNLPDPLQLDGPLVLVQPLPTLDPGDYRVQWRVLSTDGHLTAGTYTFTVAAGGAVAAAGAVPDGGPETVTPAPAAPAVEPGWVVVGVATAVAAGAVTLAYGFHLHTRRRWS